MSNSTRTGKKDRERRRPSEKKHHKDDSYSGAESVPRTYTSSREEPIVVGLHEREGESSHKGEEKADVSGSWSEWIWSDDYQRNYQAKQNSLGEWEYRYESSDKVSGDQSYMPQPSYSENPGYYPKQPSGSQYSYFTEPSGLAQATVSSGFSPSNIEPSLQLGYSQPPEWAQSSGSQYQQVPESSTDSTQLPPITLPSRTILCNCDTGQGHNLCGVLIWPRDPKPSDGKITKKSSKHKPPSERKRLETIADSFPDSDTVGIQGPDGKNCGPLYVPGVVPGPPPARPSKNSSVDEHRAYDKWKKGWEEWSQITCPCRNGYFNSEGIWISGADVRNGKSPENPLWEETGGVAPRNTRMDHFRGKLFERCQ